MTLHLQIEGMMCEACVSHVSRALRSVPNVQSAQVDLRSGRATVTHEGASLEELRKAVEEEGYSLKLE